MRLIIVILFWSTGKEEIIDAILENILTNMNERFISRDSILLRSTITQLPSFLPSVKWIHLLRSIFKAHGHACIHFRFNRDTYTRGSFSAGKSHGIVISYSYYHVEKNATLWIISMMNISVVHLLGLPRIKVGLIGWNIYTDILNIKSMKDMTIFFISFVLKECMIIIVVSNFLNFVNTIIWLIENILRWGFFIQWTY